MYLLTDLLYLNKNSKWLTIREKISPNLLVVKFTFSDLFLRVCSQHKNMPNKSPLKFNDIDQAKLYYLYLSTAGARRQRL